MRAAVDRYGADTFPGSAGWLHEPASISSPPDHGYVNLSAGDQLPLLFSFSLNDGSLRLVPSAFAM